MKEIHQIYIIRIAGYLGAAYLAILGFTSLEVLIKNWYFFIGDLKLWALLQILFYWFSALAVGCLTNLVARLLKQAFCRDC